MLELHKGSGIFCAPISQPANDFRVGMEQFASDFNIRSSRTETSAAWKAMFEGWPDAIERKGMVVTAFGEAIPFQAFMISGGLLLLERDSPDQYGTRKVILSYDQICAVRLPTAMELARFQVMGFQPPI